MAAKSAAAFNEYVGRLAAETHIAITDFAHFLDALRNRHNVFHRMGCRLSDHGIENVLRGRLYSRGSPGHLPQGPQRHELAPPGS